MKIEMSIPKVWKETPAIIIGIACCGGCDPAIVEATVPLSMTGNTGKIHAGVIDCIVKGLPVNRRWY